MMKKKKVVVKKKPAGFEPEKELMATFVGHSIKGATPLLGLGKKWNELIVIEKKIEGDTIQDILLGKQKNKGLSKEWLYKHKHEIVDQLARIVAEMYNKGVIHGDMGIHNVILTKDERGKPRVWIYDFERGELAGIKSNFFSDYDFTQTYILERMARSKEEEEELKKLFREKFEEYLQRERGVPIEDSGLPKKVEEKVQENINRIEYWKREKELTAIIRDERGVGRKKKGKARDLVEKLAKERGIKITGRSLEEIIQDLRKKGVEIFYEFEPIRVEKKKKGGWHVYVYYD